MNYKMIFYTIRQIFIIISAFLVVPMIVALVYKESATPYFIEIGIFLLSAFLISPKKPKDTTIYSREAMVSIGLSWVAISVLGALLYVFSGTIKSYPDALFEMTSGITTTGATILSEIESLPHGILFFRCWTNWIGGVGILVFMLALTSSSDQSGFYLLKAESTGPSAGKLTTKLSKSARAIFFIYVGLSLLQFVVLHLGGVDAFNASTLTFATAGTGGFAPMNSSIASYNSLFVEIVLTVFMFLFSINFYLYFLVLIGKGLTALKNEEFRIFCLIFSGTIILISINLISVYGDFWTALRYASFHVSSASSSSGFAIADYNTWPAFSQTLIMMLCLIGGCAGSTAGGLKVIRFVGVSKTSYLKTKQVINPRKISKLKIDGKVQDDEFVSSLYFYFIVYVLIICICSLIVSLDKNMDVVSAVTSVIATFNNAGPGLAKVGSMENYAFVSVFNKYFFSLVMLIGRLEIFPILLLFMPSTWKKVHKS